MGVVLGTLLPNPLGITGVMLILLCKYLDPISNLHNFILFIRENKPLHTKVGVTYIGRYVNIHIL